MQKLIADIQRKEMNRLEFLQFVGLGLLLLTGVSRVIKVLHGLSSGKSVSGYGSSPYGQ